MDPPIIEKLEILTVGALRSVIGTNDKAAALTCRLKDSTELSGALLGPGRNPKLKIILNKKF